MVHYSHKEETPKQRIFQQEEPKKRWNLRRNRRNPTSKADKPKGRILMEEKANGKLQNEEPKKRGNQTGRFDDWKDLFRTETFRNSLQ